MLRPNEFGLGLAVDADGVLRDASGAPIPGLYAVGAARRGVAWEVGAIPALRKQAASLAEHLLPGQTRGQAPGRALPA